MGFFKRNAACKPLYVRHLRQHGTHGGERLFGLYKKSYVNLSAPYGFGRPQRMGKKTAQEARTHSRLRVPDGFKQAVLHGTVVQIFGDFQITPRRIVQNNVLAIGIHGKVCNLRQNAVGARKGRGSQHVGKQRTCGKDFRRKGGQRKRLKIYRAELAQKLFV